MFTDDNGNITGDFGTPLTQKRPPEPANAVEEAPNGNEASEANRESEEANADGKKPTLENANANADAAAEPAAEEAEKGKQKTEEELAEEANKEQQAAEGKQTQPLEVDFKEKTAEKPKETEQQRESASVSPEQVLQFLKTNDPSLKDVESLADISKKVKLPDPVLKFQQFHEATGRGIQDFTNLQKDWAKESEESAIKEHLKLSEKGITSDDIDLQMELLRVPSGDEAADFSESEIKERKVKWRKAHRTALEFLLGKQEEYKTPLGNQQREEKRELSADEIAELHQPYWNQRDESLKNFTDYSLSTSIGEVSVKVTEEEKQLIANAMQTQETFFQDWKTDEGINTDSAVVDMAFRIPTIRQRILKDIISQIHTLSLEDLSNAQRNVNLEGVKSKTQPEPTITGEVIDSRDPVQKQGFGESVLRKRKN